MFVNIVCFNFGLNAQTSPWSNIPLTTQVEWGGSSNCPLPVPNAAPYIDLGDGVLSNVLNDDSFTIDFWFIRTDSDYKTVLFETTDLEIYLDDNKLWLNETQCANVDAFPLINPYGRWMHVALTYNGDSDVDMFFSTSAVTTISIQNIPFTKPIYDSNSPFQFGNPGGTGGTAISGFRVWDTCLSETEQSYVRLRAFKGENTFHDEFKNLDSNLKVNCLTDDGSVPEPRYYDQKGIITNFDDILGTTGCMPRTFIYPELINVPHLPIKAYNFTGTVNEACDEITLNWEANSPNHTYTISRKWGENDYIVLEEEYLNTSYVDSNLPEGVEVIEYLVQTWWLNVENPLLITPVYYANYLQNDSIGEQIVIEFPVFESVTGLTASNDRCDGMIELKWNVAHAQDTINDQAPSYKIEYRIEPGEWEILTANCSDTTFIHDLASDYSKYSKEIEYRIDANGDISQNFSDIAYGMGNEQCTSTPTMDSCRNINNNPVVYWSFSQTGPPATAFKIYRKIGQGTNPYVLLESNVDIDSTQYVDYEAPMCEEYSYRLFVSNNCGESPNPSGNSEFVYIDSDFENVFSSENALDASKGYYSDKVELEWSANENNIGDIDAYEIYRKEFGGTNTLIATIENANATTYVDQTCEANKSYQYSIRASGECSGSTIYSDVAYAVGFRITTGIVSGKVSYAGGSPVEGVSIRVTSEDDITVTSGNFNDISVYGVSNDFYGDSLLYKPLSFESWIKTAVNNDPQQVVFSICDGAINIGISYQRPYLEINQNSLINNPVDNITRITSDSTINLNTWYHIAADIDPISGNIKLFLNGDLVASQNSTSLNGSPWLNSPQIDADSTNVIVGAGIESVTNNFCFHGSIDELRIWQRSRTPEEIKNNYQLLKSGTEEGLIGYYRMNENFGEAFYDLSKTGNEFNKNDFEVVKPAEVDDFWSLNCPSSEQLHSGAITDQYGNYSIRAIQYSGSGNVFEVAPLFGVHEFSPSNQSLFIGDGNPVVNNVDFQDESVFEFVAEALYQGTNVPVEGANVYVDNTQQFDAGGVPLTTNELGQVTIYVPIGEHYVQIRKDGHTFENNGQWPAPTEYDEYPTHNFQDNVPIQAFNDLTTVTVVGRFVGGDYEGDKKLGFNKSVANIGAGTISISNEQGYDIDTTSSYNSSLIINTSSESGEYMVELLPIIYKIESVENDHYTIEALDLGNLDLSDIEEATVVYDTVFNEDSIVQSVDSISYDFSRNFIHYTEPTITVTGENDEPLIGEKEYIAYNTIAEVEEILDLENNSPFRYPIFLTGKTYVINIKVEAIYDNFDNAEVISYKTPVKNAEVIIVNTLEPNTSPMTFETNDNGLVEDYSNFVVTYPNIYQNIENGTSYTKTMSITANTEGYHVNWMEEPYRAYVLGAEEIDGNNFVTRGTEIPKFVLRDPPGDASYTTLEEGSSYTSVKNYSFLQSWEYSHEHTISLGYDFEFQTGVPGATVTHETDITADGIVGGNCTTGVNKNGEMEETYTFSRSFSTSSDPDQVGSMADVYIGEGENLYFSESMNLHIYSKDYCNNSTLDFLGDNELQDATSLYTIGKKPGYTYKKDPSSTIFIYTQEHILETLIPTYKEQIYALLATEDYESQIEVDHPYYGLSNNNSVWDENDENPSYTYSGSGEDEIEFYNLQIDFWVQTIYCNELLKYLPIPTVENISIDGSAGEYSNSVEHSMGMTNEIERTYTYNSHGGFAAGCEINGLGAVTEHSWAYDEEGTVGQCETVENSIIWTYVIDDSNYGDFFSVDVFYAPLQFGPFGFYPTVYNDFDFLNQDQGTNTFGYYEGENLSYHINNMERYRTRLDNETNIIMGQESSPIFRLTGGQTRCPHEGEEYTIFFIDGNSNPFLLTPGTQNHEAPNIEIASLSTVYNVPDDEPAVFELLLINESPTGFDLSYELQVNEAANPDGAIIKLDGLSPNRPFWIPGGETIVKTLTVEKGASEVLDYDDLEIILRSECDEGIADTVAFSAHFIPTCTDVEFANIDQNWILNENNEDNFDVTVSGYNINLSTFEEIKVWYQQAGCTPTLVTTLVNDTAVENTSDLIHINGQSDVTFAWDASNLNDGNYELFLTSMCSDNSVTESERMVGIIDRRAPMPYGAPEPSDGILTYGEDISVLFNENINTGELYNFGQYGTQSNISVRGIKNGTDLIDNPDLLHNASVRFDGEDDFMRIEHVNLDHTNFTIEFWAKRNVLGRENIINMGTPSQGGLWMGFDAENHFVIEVDGQSVISNSIYETLDDWGFYSISYNRGDATTSPQFKLLIFSGTSSTPQIQELDFYSTMEGTMYVGYCPEDGTAFNGNIHEFRIWNYERETAEITSQKGQILNGYEEGLYSLWPMTECSGTIARDIAFGRNAVLNATWDVSNDGKSVVFDGTNNLSIPTSSMSFSDQADFTMEFWFKTPAPTTDVTLISNGDFNNDYNVNAWSVTANSSQNIIVSNSGNDIQINGANYLNNNWHHFAMSMNRIGYLSIYIDGELIETSSVTEFGGFGASQLVAGAMWYNLAMNDYYNNYMTGYIDEIRVWNSARTQDQIQRYMNHTLTGNEMGLKAYYPFEDISDPSSTADIDSAYNYTLDTVGVALNVILPIDMCSSEIPYMKLQRPEVLLQHSIVLNDNGVVISTDVEDAEIENQILDISIKNVKDLYGNNMESTLTWPAFIDKNNVVWDVQELNIEKLIEEEITITVNIRNKGGLNENFVINNIPYWMDVSPNSGSLMPLEVKEVEITINPELNIGEYQRDINLVASMGYNERLTLNIKVKGVLPDWNVNTEDYINTSNVIGQLSIAEILSTDEDDVIACFVGNECRGVSNIQYFDNMDTYLCFMNVYSNEIGETMTFKVYDASTGDVYSNVTPELGFEPNELYGTLNDPLQINATNYVDQLIDLSSGWNWISFNVYSNDFNNLDLAFQNLTTESGDLIKSQNDFSSVTENSNGNGSLNSLDLISGYKLNVDNSQNLIMSGYKVIADTLDIPIVDGWNWISYPLSVQKPLMDALSSLNPTENDIIKSQHQFAVYSNLQGWIGSLINMQPGNAYILYSQTDGVLNYSTNIATRNYFDFENQDLDLPNTEHNMCMIVETDLEIIEDCKIYAYDENGLCGKANPVIMADGNLRYFITINSNSHNTIRFEAESLNEKYNAKENIGFSKNKVVGSLDEPFMLNFKESQVLTDNKIDVYPNPFNDKIWIDLYLVEDGDIYFKLVNSVGQEVSTSKISKKKGMHSIDLLNALKHEESLTSGVYMLKVSVNNSDKFIKIVKN